MNPSSESGTHEIRNGNPKELQPLASPEFLISRLIPQWTHHLNLELTKSGMAIAKDSSRWLLLSS